MNTPFSQESQKTTQEVLLRATLREHAPQTIDLEQGWVKISAQVSAQTGRTASSRELRWFPQHAQGERHLVRRWKVFAVAAALLIALIGAGLAGPLSGWLGRNQQVYAQVNQTKQDQGITITMTKAYASLRGTYLAFRITLPSSEQRTAFAVAFAVLRYQDETLQAPEIVGLRVSNEGRENAFNFPALNPPTGIQEVTLTWHVTRIGLLDMRGKKTFVKGDWTFTFTIPFHHDYSEPGALLSASESSLMFAFA
jgi:hypothetical protein